MARLRIGCSGWNYASWTGRFYPAGLPSSQWLAFYLAHFDTVETNATFHRLPARETFASWQAQTPDGFVMAIKASRYLTHLKRLAEPEEPIARLFERAPRRGVDPGRAAAPRSGACGGRTVGLRAARNVRPERWARTPPRRSRSGTPESVAAGTLRSARFQTSPLSTIGA